jgi:hypothetical protein
MSKSWPLHGQREVPITKKRARGERQGRKGALVEIAVYFLHNDAAAARGPVEAKIKIQNKLNLMRVADRALLSCAVGATATRRFVVY